LHLAFRVQLKTVQRDVPCRQLLLPQ